MPASLAGPEFAGAGTVSPPPLVVYVALQAVPQPASLPGAGGFPGGAARRPLDQAICEVGDRLILTTLFLSDNGTPTQPDQGPWFRIAGPDGGPVTVWQYGDPAVQSDGSGMFSLPWTPQLPGRYFWRVWSTGQIERAHVGSVVVLPDPSNRNPGSSGVTLPPVGASGVGNVV